MGTITDLIASLDWIDRVEGVVSTFVNADWNGAYERAGVPGLLSEFGASVTGQNRWTIEVPRDCGWSGIEIERLLRRHGVKIWGRGFTPKTLRFYVKRRQANWAEYLLFRRGIPVVSRLFNPANVEYGERHAPGSEPPTSGRRRQPQSKGDLIDRLLSWLD